MCRAQSAPVPLPATEDAYKLGLPYVGGTQAAPIGSAMSGTFSAIGGNTNKIVWQNKTPYRVGQAGGSTTTAGGLVFRGDPDGNFLALEDRRVLGARQLLLHLHAAPMDVRAGHCRISFGRLHRPRESGRPRHNRSHPEPLLVRGHE
jgi:hypothetical protein